MYSGGWCVTVLKQASKEIWYSTSFPIFFCWNKQINKVLYFSNFIFIIIFIIFIFTQKNS